MQNMIGKGSNFREESAVSSSTDILKKWWGSSIEKAPAMGSVKDWLDSKILLSASKPAPRRGGIGERGDKDSIADSTKQTSGKAVGFEDLEGIECLTRFAHKIVNVSGHGEVGLQSHA